MKVTKKLLSEVVTNHVSEDAVKVAKYLVGKTDVSELLVAEDLKLNVQEARAILYKLFEAGLTKFQRKRDKHKGWHISHWDFLEENVIKLHKKSHYDKISQLKQRLDREQNNEFYMCSYACNRMDFDKAATINYKCPECGGLMNPQDNSRTIEFLGEKIKEMESMGI